MSGQRIVLTCVGSYGDLHPFVAVALRLKAEGFSPVIAAMELYRPKVEGEGLDFHSVRPTPERLLADSRLSETELARRTMQGSTVFLIDTMIAPYLEETYADLLQAMDGADLVIASSFSFVARAAAERRGLPVITLLLSPMLFFSPHDAPYMKEAPWLPAFKKVFGLAGARLALTAMRTGAGLAVQPTRSLRRREGIGPITGSELMDGPLQAQSVIALYSPRLAALPPDAPPQSLVAGFTFYDSEAGGPVRLDDDLAQFLADGSPPLVFTLGSFAVYAPGRFYEEAAETARRLGRRAVLLVGPQARHADLASKPVFVTRYAPHSLVFPHAEAVIHHGGVGTTGQALRAGRVQLVCPTLGDQPDNAERLVRLGVARRIDHARFTADRATPVLAELLQDRSAADAAARLARDVALEDGAGKVVEQVRALLAARAEASAQPRALALAGR